MFTNQIFYDTSMGFECTLKFRLEIRVLTRKGVMSKLMIVKFVVALFIDIRRFLEFSANLAEFLKKYLSG